MGQILSHPVTKKSSEEGGDKFTAYGLSCMQGWRTGMEDAHTTVLDMKYVEMDPTKITVLSDADEAKQAAARLETEDTKTQVAFYGVFDGHGGEKNAIFTGANVARILKSTAAWKAGDLPKTLTDGFLATDVAILEDKELSNDPSGCAATSCFITKDKIVCGNAGDSRTIMSVGGLVKALSYDHKPTNEGEKQRIEQAGGYVDLGRVNGNLALSRGIGDFEFKHAPNIPPEEQAVTAYPDVIVHDATTEDEFVVLACDGIWDCLTSQQVVDFVRRGVKSKWPLTQICETMMDTCLAPTSGGSGIGCDNMSVCIVALLRGEETLEEWYDKIAAKISDDDLAKLPSPDDLSMDLYKTDLESKEQLHREGNDEDEDPMLKGDVGGGPGPNLLQQLLAASSVSRGENDVIYLDPSSSSILQSLGVMEEEDDEDKEDEEDDGKMEEIDDNEKKEAAEAEEEESTSKTSASGSGSASKPSAASSGASGKSDSSDKQ